MANTAQRHIYLDDVSSLSVTTYNDLALDLTATSWGFGATSAGATKITSDIADVQFWFGAYIDLSVEANRRLFITAGGQPVDPAIAAASALGTPIVRFAATTVASWHTNTGTGGGFTVNGALTTGTGPVGL